MATMQFDLVSPERRLASMEVTEVQIPGADGDLTAMSDHAPLITTLRPGVLKVSGPQGEKSFFVTGDFAYIAGPSATILAQRAMPVDEVTQEIMDELVDEGVKKRDEARKGSVDGAADAVAKFLGDLVAVGDEINLPVRSRVPAP